MHAGTDVNRYVTLVYQLHVMLKVHTNELQPIGNHADLSLHNGPLLVPNPWNIQDRHYKKGFSGHSKAILVVV